MKNIDLCFRVVACALAFLAGSTSAQTIDGTGALTGTVTAPVDYRAAQVYAMNTDKNVQYIVYTAEGSYRAPNIFPGRYEVRVKGKDLESGSMQISPFIGINNLFDESYNSNVRINAFGGRFYEPAPDRNFYAGVTLRFNR